MTPPEGVDGAVPVSELTYTEASRELDAIVEFFEQREVDVDQLVVRLERATAIVDELDRRVRQTRVQVEELVPRLEAVSRAVDVDTDEAGVAAGRNPTGEDHGDAEDDPTGEDDTTGEDAEDAESATDDAAANIGDGRAEDEGDEQALF